MSTYKQDETPEWLNQTNSSGLTWGLTYLFIYLFIPFVWKVHSAVLLTLSTTIVGYICFI